MNVRVAAAVLALACASCAQVVVHGAFPGGGDAVVRAFLDERFGASVRYESRAVGEIGAAVALAMAPDVVVGVDALTLAGLAADDRLAPWPANAAADLPASNRAATYVLPWTSAFVLARRAAIAADAAPADLDDLLFDPEMAERFVVPNFDDAPSLFAPLVARDLRIHDDERHAFGWLLRLETRSKGYVAPSRIAAELTAGTADFAIVALADVLSASPPGSASSALAWHVPSRGVPQQPLGVARTAQASPASVDVATALAGADLALRLARDARLLPAPRAGVEIDVSPALAEVRAALLPAFVDVATYRRWVATWRESVTGRGAAAEELGSVLDLVFVGAFVAFLLFVYRRLNATEEPLR